MAMILVIISLSMPAYIVFVVPFTIGYVVVLVSQNTVFSLLTCYDMFWYSLNYDTAGSFCLISSINFLQKYFLPTNRQLKRIESAQRSQLVAVLAQNIEGAESIRAYRRVSVVKGWVGRDTIIGTQLVIENYANFQSSVLYRRVFSIQYMTYLGAFLYW